MFSEQTSPNKSAQKEIFLYEVYAPLYYAMFETFLRHPVFYLHLCLIFTITLNMFDVNKFDVNTNGCSNVSVMALFSSRYRTNILSCLLRGRYLHSGRIYYTFIAVV